jgi:hypothetical protein
MVIRIANITRCTRVFAHNKEAVVSEKRNELEATVQLLSNQITADATTQEMAAITQRVATELANWLP